MKTKITITLLLITSIGFSQTKDSVYNYLIEIGVKHPKIVLKQAILETGHFKSYSCRVRKNLFGITIDGSLKVFDTWEESCDKYLVYIQQRYKYKYKEDNYYEFLDCLGYHKDGSIIRYASDTLYTNKLKRIKI